MTNETKVDRVLFILSTPGGFQDLKTSTELEQLCNTWFFFPQYLYTIFFLFYLDSAEKKDNAEIW